MYAPYPENMMESIKKVEATRAQRMATEPRRLTADEKDALLKKFHPDYNPDAFAEIPVCNAVFSALLNWAGYDQTADIAMGAAAQNTGVRSVISVSYIGAETAAHFICAILIFFFTVEKKLKEEQHS